MVIFRNMISNTVSRLSNKYVHMSFAFVSIQSKQADGRKIFLCCVCLSFIVQKYFILNFKSPRISRILLRSEKKSFSKCWVDLLYLH